MTLAVIGAGLGRTGTLSLKAALEQLGFGPCHHMTEVAADHARQSEIWNRVAGGDERDWEAVFAGYRAAVDWPACHYWAELAEAFPEAKVVLSLRDPAKWYASMAETIFRFPMPEAVPYQSGAAMAPMWFAAEIVMRQTFAGKRDEASVIAAYERHNAAVRAAIPPERLLEFEVAQGWEPLCAFLDVPVPDTPFPRVNDQAMFRALASKGGAELE